MNRYAIGGFVLDTAIDFPELVETREPADLLLEHGHVPENLAHPATVRSFFQCNEREALFRVAGVARYHVIEGKTVRIGLIDTARKTDAERYVLTLVLAVLSYRAGYFPLHGGGIVHNGEAYLFSGKSAAGKSTTIAGLVQQGFEWVGDDIANLFARDGRIYVHPCFPRFKLWKDSMDALRYQGEAYAVRSDLDKYIVPVEGTFTRTPAPVKRIYLLREGAGENHFFRTPPTGESFKRIRENIYKPWLVYAFQKVPYYFDLTAQIVSKVEFREFHRPMKKEHLNTMYQTLIEDITA